jgi:hypothetical protein
MLRRLGIELHIPHQRVQQGSGLGKVHGEVERTIHRLKGLRRPPVR